MLKFTHPNKNSTERKDTYHCITSLGHFKQPDYYGIFNKHALQQQSRSQLRESKTL